MSNNVQILIVDDDIEDRFIINEAFRELGQAGALAFIENGVELLEYLDKSGIGAVNLIILDLNMPLQSGTETLRSLKKDDRYAHVPVIIFSTSVNEFEKKNCFELGAIDYKVKPAMYSDYLALCKEFYDLSLNDV